MRLILLVRKLQHNQYAFVQRFDDVRALTNVLGSFRSDVGGLHEQLSAARESAGALEQGLSERLHKLQARADPEQESAAYEQRISHLDGLSARLETLAAQAPTELPFSAELGSALTKLKELAGRFEAAQQANNAAGGQNELAALYERIQELAEGLAHEPATTARAQAVSTAEWSEETGPFGEQLERIEAALQALQSERESGDQEAGLTRLEALAARLEQQSSRHSRPGTGPPEFAGLLTRFEELARRLEESPAALSELPPGTIADGAAAHELEELRAALGCEQEARRSVDTELEALRVKLRSFELARFETETRHAGELTQLADHAQRQQQRVEEDLKKKKRGLSELTQQNIFLQTELNRLKAEVALAQANSPVPSAKRAPTKAAHSLLAQLMAPEPGDPADPQTERSANPAP